MHAKKGGGGLNIEHGPTDLKVEEPYIVLRY